MTFPVTSPVRFPVTFPITSPIKSDVTKSFTIRPPLIMAPPLSTVNPPPIQAFLTTPSPPDVLSAASMPLEASLTSVTSIIDVIPLSIVPPFTCNLAVSSIEGTTVGV